MSKSLEYSIGLRCLKKHHEVDCVDSGILQGGCQQETTWQEQQGAASKGVCRGRDPVGDRPGDPVRKIEAPLVNPRVTSVAVGSG